ncbi:MAG: MFS transporter [Sporolactobacillus sp.]
MIKEKIWTKNFITVCLSSFFLYFNFYILATVFPLYVKSNLNGNEQQMGLAITAYVIGTVLIRPISGPWVDRLGKKKMAVIGMAVFLIATLSYFGPEGILLFLLIRFIHGMGYAVGSTAENTIASALVPDSRQGEGIGYFSMFMSLAMVIGPACGLFFWQNNNINLVLIFVSVITALSFLLVLFIRVPEQKRKKAAEVRKEEPEQKKRVHWRDLIEPSAIPISLVGFILSFSYGTLSSFFPAFTAEIHQSQIAGTFFIVFAIMIVLFRPVVGKVFDKYSEHYLFYPGIVMFALGMILLSQAHSWVMILIAGLLLGISFGALFPCFQALAVMKSSKERKGSATATFFLLYETGYGIGSFLMGMVASSFDYRTMYVVAGIVPLFSIIIYYLFYHRPQMRMRKLSE